MAKERLDRLLVTRGHFEDDEEAKRWIMAGKVFLGTQRLDKPGMRLPDDSDLRIKFKPHEYVGRGALKLLAAFERFPLSATGKTALDLGASTGGFTQVLLEKGATKVYAVDVGTNQLDYRLRIDPRVVSLERTHARLLTRELIPEAPSLLTADVSFTSLRFVLPFAWPLLSANADLICLFKPQFEAPKDALHNGIIKDQQDVEQALAGFFAWLEMGPLSCQDFFACPIKGQEGNTEFLLWLKANRYAT